MKQFPAWLQPHKNEWRTPNGLRKIMQSPHTTFSSWFESVKHRLRVVESPCRTNSGTSRKYLVKQVWAFANAHGVEIEPTSFVVPRAELVAQMDSLEREVRGLRREKLNGEKVNVVIKPWGVENLTAFLAGFYKQLLAATGPEPFPGVYFLFEGEEIVYVGQSGNVLIRMAGHAGKKFNFVKMIRIDDQKQRFETESKLISIFNPPLNVNGRSAPLSHDKLYLEVAA